MQLILIFVASIAVALLARLRQHTGLITTADLAAGVAGGTLTAALMLVTANAGIIWNTGVALFLAVALTLALTGVVHRMQAR